MSNRRQRKERATEQQRAKDEVTGIRNSLSEAYARFDGLSDPELLDACIFEISALRSHYNSAVRRQKCLYQ